MRGNRTKKRVKAHNALWMHDLVDVAGSCELRERPSPLRRVRMSALNVGGDEITTKEPDGYGFAGPLNSINTPADRIEPIPICICGP